MKVMSWNIWRGKNLEQVLDVLEKESSDIVGLQEVTTLDTLNLTEQIADKLGYYYHFCPAFTTDRHIPKFTLGDALLSKYPIKNATCHMLSTLEEYEHSSVTEPRGVVSIEVDIDGKKLTVLNTHLGYSEGFIDTELRTRQLENLEKFLLPEACILMGDLNSLPTTTVIQRLNEKMKNTDKDLTRPSYVHLKSEEKPQYRIDYIFVSPEIDVSNFTILESDASDHFPLVAELKM